MAQDIHGEKASGSVSGSSSGKHSATETIRQLTDASKQLFEAGKQVTESLSELSRRLEHAGTVGSSLAKSPWLLAGAALLAGALILSRANRRS